MSRIRVALAYFFDGFALAAIRDNLWLLSHFRHSLPAGIIEAYAAVLSEASLTACADFCEARRPRALGLKTRLWRRDALDHAIREGLKQLRHRRHEYRRIIKGITAVCAHQQLNPRRNHFQPLRAAPLRHDERNIAEDRMPRRLRFRGFGCVRLLAKLLLQRSIFRHR